MSHPVDGRKKKKKSRSSSRRDYFFIFSKKKKKKQMIEGMKKTVICVSSNTLTGEAEREGETHEKK